MRGWTRGVLATVVIASGLALGTGTAAGVTFPLLCPPYDQDVPLTVTADMPATVAPNQTLTVSNLAVTLPNAVPYPATATNVRYVVGFPTHATLIPGSVHTPTGAIVSYPIPGRSPGTFEVTFPGPYNANPNDPPITLPAISASFTVDTTVSATLDFQLSNIGLVAQTLGFTLLPECLPKTNGVQTIGSTTIVDQPPIVEVKPEVVTRSGYWMLDATGNVYSFGDTKYFGGAATAMGPVVFGVYAVHVEPTPSGNGYWVIDSRGRVYTYGDAIWLGNADPARFAVDELVSSLSATPSGRGYWIFTSRGRVLPFGDAAMYGDMAATHLNGPVLGSIATPSGKGYYMVASDGGIFAFGDAVFYGSMGATRLNAPVQSLVPTADGKGYWLVASDGGIFAFGDATFRGSMGSTHLNRAVVGMVRFGDGYLMVGADGGIFDFSDKPFLGSLGNNPPTTDITSVAAING